ncbi:MAG: hypothetical protein JRI66_09280 [Deltaproteobacteria bacterium]|nr:hypothetical protein [Deltaproteobacteria bacterium]
MGIGDLEAPWRLAGGHFLKQIDDQIDWHPLEKWLELLYHAKLLRPNHHF